MAGFDRDALVASAQKQSGGGKGFWVAVCALPVAGVAAGFFLLGPSGGPDRDGIDISAGPKFASAPKTTPAKANTSQPATVKAAGLSARAQLRQYSMVNRTLSHCASTGPSEHYYKASASYRDVNAAKLIELAEMAQTEPPEHDLSAFDMEISTNPAKIMVQGLTGQIAVNALQRQAQFTEMMADVERQQDGYLGKAPSTTECTQFRNDVIMGKYNLKTS